MFNKSLALDMQFIYPLEVFDQNQSKKIKFKVFNTLRRRRKFNSDLVESSGNDSRFCKVTKKKNEKIEIEFQEPHVEENWLLRRKNSPAYIPSTSEMMKLHDIQFCIVPHYSLIMLFGYL